MDMNFTHQQRLANGQCQIPYKKQFSCIYMYIWWTFIYKQLLLLDVHQPVHTVFTSFAFFVNNPIHIINPKSLNSFSYVQGTAPCQVPQWSDAIVVAERRPSRGPEDIQRAKWWSQESHLGMPKMVFLSHVKHDFIYGYVSNCRMQSGMFV